MCGSTSRFVCGLLGRVHTHDIEVVHISKGAVVSEHVLHNPVRCLVLGDTATVDSVLVLVVYTSTREVSTLGRTEVQTNVDAIAQTINPWAFHLTEERVVRTDTLILIEPDIFVSFHSLLGHNRLVVGRQSDKALQVAILIVWAGQRALAQHAVHVVHTLCLAIAVVGAQSEAEPLADHLVEVTANGDTVVGLCRNRRLVVIVTSAEAVAATVGAARHTHIVVVAHTRLIVQILPVGVGVLVLIQ